MFGLEFVKVDSTQYVMQFRKAQGVKEGPGLAFLYFAPTSSVVAMPTAAIEQGFMFEHVTRDFQSVTVQGQVVFPVEEPKKTAALLNFTLTADGRRYASDDATQLPGRVVRAIEVLSQQAVKGRDVKEALLATDALAAIIGTGLAEAAEIQALGPEVLGVSVAERAIRTRLEWAFAVRPWEDTTLEFAVREPFPSRSSAATLLCGRIVQGERLAMTSLMAEGGVIFSDGIEADYLEFNAGARVTITVATRRGRLVV